MLEDPANQKKNFCRFCFMWKTIFSSHGHKYGVFGHYLCHFYDNFKDFRMFEEKYAIS
jgi:hypothetical protein